MRMGTRTAPRVCCPSARATRWPVLRWVLRSVPERPPRPGWLARRRRRRSARWFFVVPADTSEHPRYTLLIHSA
ncbi:hypothetical protein EVAR_31773_1 [Eumeta japonica]|uniref:Uncharacterized protein n=1 Tax=Eumeta variegata TaxID=151549 RepID=A0A4C1W3H0_EUMVA|nr:hypothetical protein EVAR_31773_1 [Eumeta japonica]